MPPLWSVKVFHIVAMILILSLELHTCLSIIQSSNDNYQWTGYCGNIKYDNVIPVKRSGNGNSSFDRIYKKKGIKDGFYRYFKIPALFRQKAIDRRQINYLSSNNFLIERLKNEYVYVRLNIVYDETLSEEYPDQWELHNYIRHLIYSTQLIFEQPEMASFVRLNFVVVRLKALTAKLTIDMNSSSALDTFRSSSDWEPPEVADISLLLTFRNLWDHDKQEQRKILGLANVGVFCQSNARGVLILNASSLGSSITLAHELAHTFNCMHDGYEGERENFEKYCDKNSNIMSPTIGPNKMTWSNCSVSSIINYFADQKISDCIYNRTRINSAIPINERFNFLPFTSNQNRRPFPGEEKSIDAQCAKALDRTASSYQTRNGNNGPYTTCQNLICIIGGYINVGIGPAPTGSRCSTSGIYGRCLNGFCQPGVP